MKLIWCSGLTWIYGQLEEGVGSICHGYMCIVVYMNLCGVMVFQTSMLDYRMGGVNLPWVYVHCAIYIIIWCNGFPDIYAQLEHDYCVPCFTL